MSDGARRGAPTPDTTPDLDNPGSDPLAKALFRVLRPRSRADRQFVYRALAARLGHGAVRNPERVQNAVNALAICMHDAGGKAPSRRSYDDWRSGQERPDEWPSSTAIRNTFGNSWARALDALGVAPAPDVVARRLLVIGQGYEREELLDAIRTCVEDLKPRRLTWEAYRRWARDELTRDKTRRLPLAGRTIKRLCGSWADAVTAAGYPELTQQLGRRQRPRGPSYDEAAMLEYLRWASRDCGRAAITIGDYQRWRQNGQSQAEARGEVVFLPGPDAFSRRFGSWPKSLLEAGLTSAGEERLARQKGSRRLADEELLDAVCQAWQAAGAPSDKGQAKLSAADYKRWVARQIRALPSGRHKPPSHELLVKRLGPWEKVLEMARERSRQEGLDE